MCSCARTHNSIHHCRSSTKIQSDFGLRAFRAPTQAEMLFALFHGGGSMATELSPLGVQLLGEANGEVTGH